jgi:hypothetical protein
MRLSIQQTSACTESSRWRLVEQSRILLTLRRTLQHLRTAKMHYVLALYYRLSSEEILLLCEGFPEFETERQSVSEVDVTWCNLPYNTFSLTKILIDDLLGCSSPLTINLLP